mmetsp:Transcript_19700/g.35636  ORF Transcript_19700/g.35636 Transcript_19700/m.35636 type:complete len:237 (-) Transcript_19700:213-923(-)
MRALAKLDVHRRRSEPADADTTLVKPDQEHDDSDRQEPNDGQDPPPVRLEKVRAGQDHGHREHHLSRLLRRRRRRHGARRRDRGHGRGHGRRTRRRLERRGHGRRARCRHGHGGQARVRRRRRRRTTVRCVVARVEEDDGGARRDGRALDLLDRDLGRALPLNGERRHGGDVDQSELEVVVVRLPQRRRPQVADKGERDRLQVHRRVQPEVKRSGEALVHRNFKLGERTCVRSVAP